MNLTRETRMAEKAKGVLEYPTGHELLEELEEVERKILRSADIEDGCLRVLFAARREIKGLQGLLQDANSQIQELRRTAGELEGEA